MSEHAENLQTVHDGLERMALRIRELETECVHRAGEASDLRAQLAGAQQEAAAAKRELASLRIEAQKALAFKAYVHTRLDAAGVPADPEPAENAKHGCRIEGRLNWLETQLTLVRGEAEMAEQDRNALRAQLQALRELLFGKTGEPGPRDAPWEREAWRLLNEANGG